MARYEIPTLDASHMQKALGDYGQVSDAIFSQPEMDALLARYGQMQDQGLNQSYNSALLDLSRQFSPAYDAIRARNYGLYAGGQAGRDYSKVTSDLMGQLLSQRLGLGAQNSASKAAYLRALAEQRISGRQQLGSQMYGAILGAKKRPTALQQIGSGALQLGGAVLGSYAMGRGMRPNQQTPSSFPPPQASGYQNFQQTYYPQTYAGPASYRRGGW